MLHGFHKLEKSDFQAAFGIMLGIGMVSGLSSSVEYNFLLAPLGATSVIAFLAYDSEFAAPRNIVGGYCATSVVGVGTALFLGHTWWSYALGVALAMLIKRALGVVHPPSAAVPIIIISMEDRQAMLEFALESVLPGVLVLAATAVVYNRYILKLDYPLWDRQAV